MKLVNKFIRSQLELAKPLAAGATTDAERDFQDRVGRIMHFTHRRDVVINENYITEPRANLVVPRDELRGGVLFHVHGGGFVCGSMDFAMGVASKLSAECGMRVLSVEYRLAPENPYPAAIDDVCLAYDKLIQSGTPSEKIILVGESAGGGLIYSLLLRLRERGDKLPAGVIAISPWVDLTLSGDTVITNKDNDPSLTKERLAFYADCYVGAEDVYRSRRRRVRSTPPEKETLKGEADLSPLFGDLHGLPPSLIFAGEDELLLSDAKRLAEKLTAAGSQAQLVSRAGMWHSYILYSLKESRADLDTMNAFIRRCMPRGNERKLKWMHIDNAGKIYPASRTSNWYNVFRVSMTLTEEVDREVLQSALDVTVRRFPSIAVRLRRGFFWYYLQEIPRAPRVQDERSYPLVRMPFDDVRHCAFRVLIYRRRIAGEFFHSLTDGNGALIFMKTLVAEYLKQKYGAEIPATDGVFDRLEAPREEEYRDLFPKYKGVVAKKRQDADSYRIHGTPEPDGFCHVTDFMLNSDEVLSLARSYGVTVTALLAAAVIDAAIRLQNEDCKLLTRQKEIKVHLPCDFRRIYGEETMRNFALYITPGVDSRLGEYTLEEIAKIIYAKMTLDITRKNMSAAIYSNVKEEEVFLQKITPLFLKNLVLKIYSSLFGERKSVLTLSNLGVAKMPEAMQSYVDRIDFILGVQASGPYNIGVVSYKGQMHFNVIRNIKEPRLELELYRTLRSAGIHVKVESNER